MKDGVVGAEALCGRPRSHPRCCAARLGRVAASVGRTPRSPAQGSRALRPPPKARLGRRRSRRPRRRTPRRVDSQVELRMSGRAIGGPLGVSFGRPLPQKIEWGHGTSAQHVPMTERPTDAGSTPDRPWNDPAPTPDPRASKRRVSVVRSFVPRWGAPGSDLGCLPDRLATHAVDFSKDVSNFRTNPKLPRGTHPATLCEEPPELTPNRDQHCTPGGSVCLREQALAAEGCS